MSVAESLWVETKSLLKTHLNGRTTADDIVTWISSLDREIGRARPGTFRLLVDLREYAPADLPTHKQMRVVIPLFLARHGFRTALLDLVDGGELTLSHDDGRICVAVAHVHHDPEKMADYEARVGNAAERFFIDVNDAEGWLSRTPTENRTRRSR